MIWLFLILLTPADGHAQTFPGMLTVCHDTLDFSVLIDITLRPQNQYTLTYLGNREILANSEMVLSFDSEVSLKLIEPIRAARISKLTDNRYRRNQFIVKFTEKTSYLRIQVLGPDSGHTMPYIRSVILNHVELCKNPKTGYLDYVIERPEESLIDDGTVVVIEDTKKESENTGNFNDDAKLVLGERNPETSSIDKSCGRRKVEHTELIVLGQPTQPGEWPWHAAILNFHGSSLEFRCGGTLLSKTMVITAAHCVTREGNPVVPNSLSVVLGKYNLYGGDKAAQERGVHPFKLEADQPSKGKGSADRHLLAILDMQERCGDVSQEVFEVIVHPAFHSSAKTVNNDIALLRLKSEVIFDDYVQPACLWHTALPTEEVFGTVVGWGFNHQDALSLTLQKTTVPIVSELTCLKSDPIFFQSRLNTNKFCAGLTNGTSVCNGDSGGGLTIFVPDASAGDTGKASGAWYIRGIVSFSRKRPDAHVCDPNQYTIFTDVEKYRDWVMQYLN